MAEWREEHPELYVGVCTLTVTIAVLTLDAIVQVLSGRWWAVPDFSLIGRWF